MVINSIPQVRDLFVASIGIPIVGGTTIPHTPSGSIDYPSGISSMTGWEIPELNGCKCLFYWQNNTLSSLVAGFNPSEKYYIVICDYKIPNIWKNNPNVPNHQPDL